MVSIRVKLHYNVCSVMLLVVLVQVEIKINVSLALTHLSFTSIPVSIIALPILSITMVSVKSAMMTVSHVKMQYHVNLVKMVYSFKF